MILDGKFYNFNQQREFYSPFPELQELPYNLKSRREVIDAKAIKKLKGKTRNKGNFPKGTHAEGARADGCTSSNLLFDCSIFVIGKKNTSTIQIPESIPYKFISLQKRDKNFYKSNKIRNLFENLTIP